MADFPTEGTSPAILAYDFEIRLREGIFFDGPMSKTPCLERHYCDGVEIRRPDHESNEA